MKCFPLELSSIRVVQNVCPIMLVFLQVNKRKGEEYQLFWSAEPDFVRMAAKLNALIIPFASVGADEAFDIALDSDEVLNTPVLGGLMRQIMQRVDPSLDLSESVPPLTNLPGTSIPSLLPVPNLSRLYFRYTSSTQHAAFDFPHQIQMGH